MAAKLDGGDLFPDIRLRTGGGDEIVLPDGLETPWTFVLFYRGHW